MTNQPEVPDSSTASPGEPAAANSGDNDAAIFTQADADRIALKARNEAKRSAYNTLLEELGLNDVDTLKARVKDSITREQSERTELEKLQAEIATRDSAMKAMEEKLKDSALDRAVIEAAADLKFYNWQEAKKLADLSGVDTSTTDGGASAVKSALEELAKGSPHLIQSDQPATPPKQQGAGVMNPGTKIGLTGADLKNMSPQEVLRLMQEHPDAVDHALRNPD